MGQLVPLYNSVVSVDAKVWRETRKERSRPGDSDASRVVTLRCQIGYMDHAGCHQSVFFTNAKERGEKCQLSPLDEKTGEKVSVSRKCADINATVPDMMGVSKAILENVVFVHQVGAARLTTFCCASKHYSIDDSQYCPCNQSHTTGSDNPGTRKTATGRWGSRRI